MVAFNPLPAALVLVTLTVLAVAQPPIQVYVSLGSATDFVILTKAGISTVPKSVITGDIGVSPIAATAMTGFSLIADASNMFSTSAQVLNSNPSCHLHRPAPVTLRYRLQPQTHYSNRSQASATRQTTLRRPLQR